MVQRITPRRFWEYEPDEKLTIEEYKQALTDVALASVPPCWREEAMEVVKSKLGEIKAAVLTPRQIAELCWRKVWFGALPPFDVWEFFKSLTEAELALGGIPEPVEDEDPEANAEKGEQK